MPRLQQVTIIDFREKNHTILTEIHFFVLTENYDVTFQIVNW